MSLIDKVLGNRYLIEEEVGIGGMAVVYKAKDRILNRYVAVKVLKDQYIDDDDFLKKFAIEAQSAASITHPNIVSIYDVGSSTLEGKKYNYIVMEYIQGVTLKEYINKNAPLEIPEVVDFGVQIASALECAHKNDIIHRDIKPQNILLNADKQLKVTDFGIARIVTSSTITYTSTVLGTVHYISPEQAKGKYVDEKSDIYSLGIVLYEMCTGRVPFDASNPVGIALKHIQENLIEPIEYNAGIPQGMNEIILMALSKDPEYRFNSAKELKEALLNYKKFKDVFGHTQRTKKIVAGSIEEEIENEGVYTFNAEEPEEIVEEEKEEKSFFKRNILPILLALVVFVGFIVAKNTFFNKEDQEQVEVELVKVPAVVELPEDKAIEILEEKGLAFEIEYLVHDSIPENYVISQDPQENEEVEEGTVVKLEVSLGKDTVPVPNLLNLTLENAEAELNRVELSVGEVFYQEHDSIEEGHVIEQIPRIGVEVATNSKVDLTISKGKQEKTVEIPDLRGQTLAEATKILRNLGLNIGMIDRQESREYEENQVIWQQYRNGTELKQGETVDLVVSKGYEEVEEEPKPKPKPMKRYDFQINKPEKDGDYKLTINKITPNGEEVNVYEETRNVSEGDIRLTIEEEPNLKFKVYIDGEQADSSNQ